MTAVPAQGLPLHVAWQQAVAHHQAGRLQQAEQLYRAILQAQPGNPDANHNLGVLAGQAGQHAAGLPYLQAALTSNPAHEQYVLSYAQALLTTGQPAEALAILKGATQRGLASVAVRSLLQNAEATTLNSQKHAKDPSAIEMSQLAALFNGGRYAELEAQASIFVERNPNSGNAWKVLSEAFLLQGKHALQALQTASKLLPNDADLHCNLGYALRESGQFHRAIASCRRALEIRPNFAEAHCNLANALQDLGEIKEALVSYHSALNLKPDYAQAHNNLGHALLGLDQIGEAVASFRRAMEINPDYADARSSLLFALSHHIGVDAKTLFAEHIRFGEQFEAPLRATWPQHDNSRDPDRPLQIGFVSGDLRNHAVAVFIEPILAHLVGNTQLSLHAYYTHGMEDDVTRRIKGLVAHWHPVVGLSDADLAQRIRADGIDILIDLSGHTAHNRLLAFVRKPAPLQVSWIGYPGTTGLRSMDYYLADRFFLPVEQFADQFTEKIVYLPSTVPFLPFADAPPINPLPALANGYVTFGSFNRTNKISRPVIAMWAELLRAVPDSRMVLGGLAAGSQSENLLTWFDQEGIARERLSGYPRSDMATYLGLHHQVDLCLDTFPYTGGTTTCHALWMGVPTLTLVGKTSFGRDGTGLLSGVGLEAFVAHDAGDFVRKGVAWAQQCEALAAIRSQLRERFAQSPIGQPALVAAGLERALRTMWQRWCAGLPPEHF